MDDRGDGEGGGEVHSAFGVWDEDEANHISAGLDSDFGSFDSAAVPRSEAKGQCSVREPRSKNY